MRFSLFFLLVFINISTDIFAGEVLLSRDDLIAAVVNGKIQAIANARVNLDWQHQMNIRTTVPSIITYEKCSFLHFAVINANPSLVKVLLEKVSLLLNQRDKLGKLPFSYAVEFLERSRLSHPRNEPEYNKYRKIFLLMLHNKFFSNTDEFRDLSSIIEDNFQHRKENELASDYTKLRWANAFLNSRAIPGYDLEPSWLFEGKNFIEWVGQKSLSTEILHELALNFLKQLKDDEERGFFLQGILAYKLPTDKNSNEFSVALQAWQDAILSFIEKFPKVLTPEHLDTSERLQLFVQDLIPAFKINLALMNTDFVTDPRVQDWIPERRIIDKIEWNFLIKTNRWLEEKIVFLKIVNGQALFQFNPNKKLKIIASVENDDGFFKDNDFYNIEYPLPLINKASELIHRFPLSVSADCTKIDLTENHKYSVRTSDEN